MLQDLGVLVYSCVSCHFVVCPECTERITKQYVWCLLLSCVSLSISPGLSGNDCDDRMYTGRHKEPPWCVESGSTAAEIALAFGHRSLSTKFTR